MIQYLGLFFFEGICECWKSSQSQSNKIWVVNGRVFFKFLYLGGNLKIWESGIFGKRVSQIEISFGINYSLILNYFGDCESFSYRNWIKLILNCLFCQVFGRGKEILFLGENNII